MAVILDNYDMPRITLRVDAEVLERAKRYAKSRGLSLPTIVGAYLKSIADNFEDSEKPPVLKSLRGSIQNADLEKHREHLVHKHH